jgi:hypothetical protein
MPCPIGVIGSQHGLDETRLSLRQQRTRQPAMKPGAHRICAGKPSIPMYKEVPMLFLNRSANWDNRDYRVYCDQRTRQKRRLRLRMSIGVTLALMLGMLLAAWF